MRVLLDECIPRKLRNELPGHEVRTVVEMGWAGARNGELLRRASADFDVFLTVDQGIEFQQSLKGIDIAVVVMVTRSNDIDDLRPLLPNVLSAVVIAPLAQATVVRA